MSSFLAEFPEVSTFLAFYSGGAAAVLLHGVAQTVRLSGTAELGGAPMMNATRLGLTMPYVVFGAAFWPVALLISFLFAFRGEPRHERVFQLARVWFYLWRLSPTAKDRDLFLREAERRLFNEIALNEGHRELPYREPVTEAWRRDGESTIEQTIVAMGGEIATVPPALTRLECDCGEAFARVLRNGSSVAGVQLVAEGREAGWHVFVEFEGVKAVCPQCRTEP